MLVDVVEGPSDPPLDTMRLARLEPADMLLRLDAPDGRHRMRVIADAVMTRWDETDVVVRDGVVEIPDGDIVQVTVHRHGRITPSPYAALLSGWGNWTGAVATTVAHDTHNLVVFGRDPHDMALAANTVIASGGGVAVRARGEVLAHVALPIAGILSPLPAAEVAAAQKTVQDAAIEIGLFAPTLTQPLFQVMLSSLACLPGPHVTDVGLIDGTTGEVVADRADVADARFASARQPASQAAIPARVRCLSSAGAPDASIEHVATCASVASSRPIVGAHQLVLLEQVRAEEQRVVGVEAAAHARREQRGQRVRRRCRGRPRAARSRSGTRRGTRANRRAGARAPDPRSPARRAAGGRRRARRARPAPRPGRRARPRGERSAARRRGRSRTPRRTAPAGGPVSSLASPKPTTPRSAYFTARCACSTASAGSSVRSAATMIPTPMSFARAASAAAPRMISRVSVGGPRRALWCGR